MKQDRIVTKELDINAEVIDVTDPCYDVDTWCRIRVKIKPGKYKCTAKLTLNTGGWGERVESLRLINSEIEEDNLKCNGRAVGYIGVDAGLAGFFVDKPDYDDKDWSNFVNELWTKDNRYKDSLFIGANDNYVKCVGAFCPSGYGDGSYPVYQFKDKNTGEIAGYEITFI